MDIFRARAKLIAHDAQGFFHNALFGWPPAAVQGSDNFIPGIGQQHGETVCNEDAKSNAGYGGDQAVADHGIGLRAADDVNDIRVDLADSDQGPALSLCDRASGFKKKRAIALDTLSQIVFGEPKIKRWAAVGRAGASGARAESVDEPGNALERGSAENL